MNLLSINFIVAAVAVLSLHFTLSVEGALCADPLTTCLASTENAGGCVTMGTTQCTCNNNFANVGDDCVAGEACGAGETCTTTTSPGALVPGYTGTCVVATGTQCTCAAAGYVNVGDTCVAGEACGATAACTGAEYTGTCVADNGTQCTCAAGYVNSADTCVAKAPGACGAGVDCAASDANTGICTMEGGDVCQCNAHYANVDKACVAGEACGTTTTCTTSPGVVAPGYTGTCVALNGQCTCADDYANVGTTCVEGTVCADPSKCTTGEAHDASGLCTVNNDQWCKCSAGHANNLIGVCVAGSVCTGSPDCTGPTHDGDMLCTADNSEWCKCNLDVANSNKDGKCVSGMACATKDMCKGDGEDGVCFPDNMTCSCEPGYLNVSNVCIASTDCVDPVHDCNDGVQHDVSGKCTAANPAWCKCADSYVNSNNDGKCVMGFNCYHTTLCRGVEYTGTCAEGDGRACVCVDDYANVNNVCLPGKACASAECLLISHTGTCKTEGESDCNCAEGYTDVSGTCVQGVPCSPAKECTDVVAHAGQHGLCMADHVTWCLCADGYLNNPTTGDCAEGKTCQGGHCVGDGYTGICMTENGADCICAADHTLSGTTANVCISGVACTSDPIPDCTDVTLHAGTEALCSAGNTEWCQCAVGYVNDTAGVCVAVTTTSSTTVATTSGAFAPERNLLSWFVLPFIFALIK